MHGLPPEDGAGDGSRKYGDRTDSVLLGNAFPAALAIGLGAVAGGAVTLGFHAGVEGFLLFGFLLFGFLPGGFFAHDGKGTGVSGRTATDSVDPIAPLSLEGLPGLPASRNHPFSEAMSITKRYFTSLLSIRS